MPELHTAYPANAKTQTTAATARTATTAAVASTDRQLISRTLVAAATTTSSVLGLVLAMR